MSSYYIGLLVLLSLNVIGAYAVYLPLSAGQLNLGIAGFMAIGAYSAAYLNNEYAWPIALAVIAGGGCAGLIALLVSLPILRTHGIYLALATFALGQVIVAVFLNLEVVGAAAGYPVMAYLSAPYIIGAAVGVIVLMALLACTRFSLYLTAIKNDATVSDLMGINVLALRVSALTLGAVIAGIGGGLYAHHFGFVEVKYFSVLLSIYTVLFVLLGGVQTVWGPLAGALFFTAIPELLRAGEQWRYLIFAAFIILFMAVRPQGLLTAAMLRRICRRGS